jgi:hypothetical protein
MRRRAVEVYAAELDGSYAGTFARMFCPRELFSEIRLTARKERGRLRMHPEELKLRPMWSVLLRIPVRLSTHFQKLKPLRNMRALPGSQRRASGRG